MAGCCDPNGYDDVFGERFARRSARRYRRRGLDATATRMVELLAADGVAGATVLEIGGGVGEIGLELLRRGAESVTSVELSSAYDQDAHRLAQEVGLGERVQRRVLDVALSPDEVDPADLVVLHRVVCCYPDHERLLGAAAGRCRGRLAFSHPPRNLVSRGILAVENGVHALRGRQFRAFAHPPQAMLQVLTRRGLRPVVRQEGRLWQVECLTR
jgi:2-polyprenyl-3-methyl-5-hydroxy-6-metoxy-1,4-benzoquinol methylase